MKKLIVLVLIAGAIGAAVWGIPKIRMRNPWLDGKTEKVERGDLIIPVSASGKVNADRLVELKSKAGGRIKEVLVKDGQRVSAGQIVMEIDPVDEQRNVNRLKAGLERAKAASEQAVIRQREAEQNRPLDVAVAERLVEQAKAQVDQAQIPVDRLVKIDSVDKNAIEEKQAQANLNSAIAMWEKAKVDLERTRNNMPIQIDTAKQDVIVAKALLDSAGRDLGEAEERLRECTVKSTIDGMVYNIPVTAGQVIQSGTSGFTGGTQLMFLSDIRKMYVIAQVDEADIGSVERIAPPFARPGHVRDVTDEELIDAAPLPPLDHNEAVEIDSSAKKDAKSDTEGREGAPQPSTRPVDVDGVTGRRVRVSVDAYRSEQFEGIIERILPMPTSLQTVTTFDVRIRLIGKDLQKLQSKTADVRFTADRRANVLRVKNEAIVSEGSNKEVFVYVPYKENPNEPEWEKKVRVDIGLTDGTYTEILSGLKEGDRVWVKRPQKSDAEQKSDQKKKNERKAA